MFVKAYLNTAEEILKIYTGEEPFHYFIKKYFSNHKKFGSRDRKYITHLCYCFFRLGGSLQNIPVSEKLLPALYLCSPSKNSLLEKINVGWNEEAGNHLPVKLAKVKEHYGLLEEEIFPFRDQLSDEIDQHKFSQSFLIQPDTYLRIRPGKKEAVMQKLNDAAIPFQLINEHCLAVEPATKLEDVLELNKDAVVQDRSSQNVLQVLLNYLRNEKIKSAWDCCAASGGKSILLKDYFPDVALTVSDIRETILTNLRKRFAQAGIKNYKSFVADLSVASLNPGSKFQLIICDAPCTGSGTWSRTPEQLYFFQERKIEEYAVLQKKIVANAVNHCAPAGLFLYITCSVFKKENEEVVSFIEDKLSLRLIGFEYLKGYEQKADTLFTALFTL